MWPRSWHGWLCRFRSQSRRSGFGALRRGQGIFLWTGSVTCTSFAGFRESRGFEYPVYRKSYRHNLKFKVCYLPTSWASSLLAAPFFPTFPFRRRSSCIDNCWCWKWTFDGLADSCIEQHFRVKIELNYLGNSLWFISNVGFVEGLLLHFFLKVFSCRNSARFWNVGFHDRSCWSFLALGFFFCLGKGCCLRLEVPCQVFRRKCRKRWLCSKPRSHWVTKSDS